MVSEIYTVIISAGIGGFITLTVTFLTNKAKRFELEYTYRKKLEERYLFNAQKHLDDVYLPLYRALTGFKNHWLESKNLNNIYDLKGLKKDLSEKGLTAFLTPEIESGLDSLFNYVSKSQGVSNIRYGIMKRYQIMGQERFSYRIFSDRIGRKIIKLYSQLLFFLNFLKRITWMYTGLIDYEIKIILDSAPVDSREFEDQLLEYLTDIEKKIKDITLGTK